ncbi:fimbria/pilus outer membrane usher protein, partial [Candidatus Venteria ishoeyi]|uniref:fimbria/pilus outer membrane usher protein n=1 Tax=Candidatus Venteria ishoeyi TaxID=1899563 RepID=UPI0011B0C4E1
VRGKLDTAISYQANGDYTGAFNWAGAMAWIPGYGVHFSRPIYDSFALVSTEQADIPVEAGGQILGTTGSSGYTLIPEISSFYKNRLKIPSEALALNLSLDKPVQYIQPSYRSGTLLHFAINKISAVEGYLYRRDAGQEIAIEQAAMTLQIDNQIHHGLIGKEGYFYFENLPVGDHQGQLRQTPCQFTVHVQDSSEIIQTVGKIFCETETGQNH